MDKRIWTTIVVAVFSTVVPMVIGAVIWYSTISAEIQINGVKLDALTKSVEALADRIEKADVGVLRSELDAFIEQVKENKQRIRDLERNG